MILCRDYKSKRDQQLYKREFKIEKNKLFEDVAVSSKFRKLSPIKLKEECETFKGYAVIVVQLQTVSFSHIMTAL